jgi:IS30 family transposase
MGRRGPKPDQAKRDAFARLIAEGVPSARACRMVGIHPRTGKRWRNGRKITSGGRVLNLAPVITVTSVPAKRYSARYLSEDERVRLADLRREGHTMREIAALMGRSPSTVSRELARGADASGRYGPFEAHRRALGRRRLRRPSRLARDAGLRDWVAGRLMARLLLGVAPRARTRRPVAADDPRLHCTSRDRAASHASGPVGHQIPARSRTACRARQWSEARCRGGGRS